MCPGTQRSGAGGGGGGWKNPEGMCDSGGALGLPEFRKYLPGDTGREKALPGTHEGKIRSRIREAGCKDLDWPK